MFGDHVVIVEIERTDALLASAPDHEGTWLSPSEQARLPTLRNAGRRQQFLAGHWLSRQVLARRSGIPAERWSLRERLDLPPLVEPPAELILDGGPVQLSIAHGGDWIAVAIAQVDIGIDLEPWPRPQGMSRLAPLLLNPDESPGSLDDDTLLQRWVLKEAHIKRLRGDALPHSLAALQLRLDVEGDILLRSSAGFHVALAAPAGCLVEWLSALPLSGAQGWQS